MAGQSSQSMTRIIGSHARKDLRSQEKRLPWRTLVLPLVLPLTRWSWHKQNTTRLVVVDWCPLFFQTTDGMGSYRRTWDFSFTMPSARQGTHTNGE
eukprot:6955292-Pyramimonas_sp.AAC.1